MQLREKAIPPELRARAQWVGWRTEVREGKPTKVPIRPHGTGYAKVSDPSTWGELAAVDLERVEGLGFVFTADDPYCGIDLDGCRNIKSGELTPWAKAILSELDSYAEVSPSGTGVHLIVKGVLPEEGRRWGSVEVYDRGRYFTFTGRRVADGNRSVTDQSRRLSTILPTLRILGQALGRGAKDIRWHDLANGEWERHDYPSQSEADLAWCSRLFFFAGDKAGADRIVDEAFRWSGLYRAEKWDRAAGGYKEATLKRARIQDLNGHGERGAGVGTLEQEILRLRNRRAAQRQVDAEDAARDFREPATVDSLADWLAADLPEPKWRIEGLLGEGMNVLFSAVAKAGKTTLLINLVRSLCDGAPFLEHFVVHPSERRIGYWNAEVGPFTFRKWLGDVTIANPEKLSVANLRGHSVDLRAPVWRAWAIEWLQRLDIGVWIVDPFARLYSGEENSNTEIRDWTNMIDEIRAQAGVEELIVAHHFGRGGEHPRGASRLEDWPDALWSVAREEEKEEDTGVRYFSAIGRDVEVEEHPLAYDPLTRDLVFQIQGASRREAKTKDPSTQFAELEDRVLAFLRANPGTMRETIVEVSGTKGGVPGKTSHKAAAVKRLVDSGRVRKEPAGGSGYRLFALSNGLGTVSDNQGSPASPSQSRQSSGRAGAPGAAPVPAGKTPSSPGRGLAASAAPQGLVLPQTGTALTRAVAAAASVRESSDSRGSQQTPNAQRRQRARAKRVIEHNGNRPHLESTEVGE